jgi:tripartite-type tricarboxylate transporter receptor subunit TctC
MGRGENMRSIYTRVTRALVVALLFACAGPVALGADFPTKTVKIVIPFSAGGAPDVLMRIVAPHLSEKWKQPVVIENRPGANTNIGTVAVTKAEADGHTLLFTSDGTFIFNPLTCGVHLVHRVHLRKTCTH